MKRTAIDEERLEFLSRMLASGDWVYGRTLQSTFHRTFGDPVYKPEMDFLRKTRGIEFEDNMVGTQHYFRYRLAPSDHAQLGIFHDSMPD